MSHELITLLMFSTMMVLLLTGQRVYGAIGFVGARERALQPAAPKSAPACGYLV